MNQQKPQNNYAYIDSQNLNLGTQKMGWKLDWGKFRRYLADKYGITKAYLFIGYLPEYESMYNQLHELGYLIVLKPTVGMNNERTSEKPHISPEDLRSGAHVPSSTLRSAAQPSTKLHDLSKVPTEQGSSSSENQESQKEPTEPAKDQKPAVKGNIDAELVLYAMKDINSYDKAIIVSGDGDFYCLVEYLVEQKKLLHLMAPNWRYSSLLKPYEQYIVRLDKARSLLAYRTYRKPQK